MPRAFGSRYTELLSKAFDDFKQNLDRAGKLIPENKPSTARDVDRTLRKLDCAAINWTIQSLESSGEIQFHSVRCVFQEGDPVYPDSEIRLRSHIQIAVRDAACVLGYFRPS